jgi:hypothetical protein
MDPQVSTGPEIRLAFDGEGTQVTEPFVLRRGTVLVAVRHDWPARGSEHFAVRLMRADGGSLFNGLIANEAIMHMDVVRTPIDSSTMVSVWQGEHVIQVTADPGSPWSVHVVQR